MVEVRVVYGATQRFLCSVFESQRNFTLEVSCSKDGVCSRSSLATQLFNPAAAFYTL